LNREGTDYANEGGWYDGDKIRFRSGFPEKIGGWSRLSNDTYLGVARALWNWIDFDAGNNYLGVGTNVKYYIEKGGQYNDITPVFATSTTLGAAAGPFTATSGSANIVITDATYAPSVGDYIIISGAVSLGGNITAAVLNQEYVVAIVGPTANQYTIQAKSPTTGLPVLANGSDTLKGGAIVKVEYLLPTGLNIAVVGTGWGVGPWSRGTWGSGYTSGFTSQLRLWSNDNFGQDLIIAPRGGGIYYWADAGGVGTRAVLLNTLSTTEGFAGTYVPNTTNQVIASSIQKFVIAMGANSYVSGTPNTPFNPMLVRWSDQLNPYEWVPAVTNQAGEFTLTHGSSIIAANPTRQEILIWTDSAL
jgi:hypothetical protein